MKVQNYRLISIFAQIINNLIHYFMGFKIYRSAKEINDIFAEYKAFQSKQFTEKPELIKSGDRAGEVIYIKVPDPMQIKSFLLFANMNEKTFFNYVNEANSVFSTEISQDDFNKLSEEEKEHRNVLQAFTRVYTEIQSKQIAGGLNNVLNPIVVSRLNGLKDSQEVEHLNQKQPDINININGKQIDITD